MKALGQLVAALDIDAPAVFLTLGLAGLFAGLWLEVSLGIALAVVGGLVFALALAVAAGAAIAEARPAAPRRPGG